MNQQTTQGTATIVQGSITVTGKVDRVTSLLVIADPKADVGIGTFTQEDYLATLRKVSRPLAKRVKA